MSIATVEEQTMSPAGVVSPLSEVDQARLDRLIEMARESGKAPSSNAVMNEFRVGRATARGLLQVLESTGLDAYKPTPRLRSVHLDESSPAVVSPVDSNAEPTPESTVESIKEPVPDPMPVPTPKPAKRTTYKPVARSRVEVQGRVADQQESTGPAESSEVESTPESPVKPSRFKGQWLLGLIAAPAFVAIWGGWVGLGEKTGFGPVRLLPGIADSFVINSAITLPIGVEAYAAFALRVCLSGSTRSRRARLFAGCSAAGSLVLGALGQVAYHLMEAAGMTRAPWPITTFVSCLPVLVLGCGAALFHMLGEES